MSTMTLHLEGIGLFGPGMSGWEQARAVLRGDAELVLAPPQLPPVDALPPAERRRVGAALKLAMSAGFEAVRHAGVDPQTLAAVFSSTGGDCDNCHQLLDTLASGDRSVSPTRFHNSVHNMPAGYWSIATGCMAPSTSLCVYDASFTGGLLEAAAQALTQNERCLLVSFDTAYPEPLFALRPIPHHFGIALVLNPVPSERSLGTLTVALSQERPDTLADAGLERLRGAIPSARSLPLLRLLAREQAGRTVLEYLDGLSLAVAFQP